MSLLHLVREAKRVYVIGNGGSFANAEHICNDLLLCGIKAFTLNASALTASANDFGYETVFARWLEVVGEPGDLLIALSGSGKSPNILRAVEVAERKEMLVWREFGAEHGLTTQPAEEQQIRLGHQVMLALRETTA